jgi:hypothetical protein
VHIRGDNVRRQTGQGGLHEAFDLVFHNKQGRVRFVTVYSTQLGRIHID